MLFGFGVLPHFASARVLFVSDDQALAAGIPAAHDRVIQISLQRATTQERFSAKQLELNKGGTAVDLSLRLNVLAVCAVFVFVGAILLGAF
jgi:hypothetical protein